MIKETLDSRQFVMPVRTMSRINKDEFTYAHILRCPGCGDLLSDTAEQLYKYTCQGCGVRTQWAGGLVFCEKDEPGDK
jgi:hypothetical protein